MSKNELLSNIIKEVNSEINEASNRDKMDAVGFYADTTSGIKFHQSFKGKFNRTAFQSYIQKIVDKATKSNRIEPVIRIWSDLLGLDYKDYTSGPIIEDVEFISDVLKKAEYLYKVFLSTPMARNESNSIDEFVWPQSKLPKSFQPQLSAELRKHFKGMWYSIGRDLYHNDKKVLTVDGDDSINGIISKLKKKIKSHETNSTANIDGYETPYAFSRKDDKKRKKKTATQAKYTIVDENGTVSNDITNEAIKSVDKSKLSKIYHSLKKGDKIKIQYTGSWSMTREGKYVELVVSKGKTLVGKRQVERITLKQVNNPTGVKFYLYNRDNNISLAVGDAASTITDIQTENVSTSTRVDEKVRFSKKLKDGNTFQVLDRDTTGMRGSQDKFSMKVVDKNGKLVKDWGSHPSLNGAIKFSNRFDSVSESVSGYKPVNKQKRTNRWLELKDDETMHPHKKMAMGLKELKYQLTEIEKFFTWYNRIKNMNELESDNYWKRTNRHIYKIKERILNIAKTIKEIEK